MFLRPNEVLTIRRFQLIVVEVLAHLSALNRRIKHDSVAVHFVFIVSTAYYLSARKLK